MTQKLELVNTNFSAGQFSSQMLTREDVASYNSGAETLTNCIPHLQGGVSRRPGTKFLADLGQETRVIGFYFVDDQEYLFCLQNTQIQVRSPTDGSLITTITGCPWTTAQLFDIRYAQAGDTTIFVHPDFKMQNIKRTGATTFTRADFAFEEDSATTDKLFQPYFKFADDSITLTPSGTSGTITLTLSAGYWADAHVGVNVRYKGKQIKITAKTSDTVVDATVIESLPSTSADVEWDEAVFSDVNGYARSVTFHSARMCFGGTKSLPQHIMMSKTNAPFNFDDGTAEADEAIFGQLGTDKVSEIRHLVSTTHLLINTNNSEFFQPESDNNPITPASFLPRRQSEYGSNRVRPINLDNAAIFVQDSGLTVREIEFNDLLQTFESNSINDFADDVLSQFDDSAVFVGDATRIEQFGVYTDHSSGNASLYHSNRHQKIFGWVPWTTEGYFWSVDQVDDRVFFVVKRTINSVTKWFLEELSDSFTTDCSISTTTTAASTTFTVTVVDPGGGNKFFIDGVQQATINLTEGNTYIFNYPSAHPFRLSATADGTHGGGSEFTTGVTHNSSTQLTFVVPTDAPPLFYYCANHSGMGGTANTPAASTTFSGATHLPSTVVRAINTAKTMEFGTFTLNGSGQFTLDTDLATVLDVGLFFAPTIVPVRIVGSAGGGSFSAKRKRLVRSILVLKDTFDITIDGKTLQLRQVDDDPSLAPSALNGTFDVYHLGWDRFGQKTITQTSALPMTLLALSREVAV